MGAKGERKRAQIVEALMRVMAAHGYERASIAMIAKEAELASGLVHYYFKSKEEILIGLMELLGTHLQMRYERRLAGADSSPWSRLDAYIEAYVGISQSSFENPKESADGQDQPDALSIGDDEPAAVACWVAIGAEALHLPAVQDVYESILRESLTQLKLHLTEVLASEGRLTEEIHLLAAGLMAAIEGSYRLGIATSGLVPVGFAGPMIKQMARGLVSAQAMRLDHKPDEVTN